MLNDYYELLCPRDWPQDEADSLPTLPTIPCVAHKGNDLLQDMTVTYALFPYTAHNPW